MSRQPTNPTPTTGTASTRERSWRLVSWLLRLAIAAQCVGAVWFIHHGPSAVHLWVERAGGSASVAGVIDAAALWALVFCAGAIVARPVWPFLLPVAAWFAATGVAEWRLHPDVFLAQVHPLAHGVRYLGPIGLLLLCPARSGRGPIDETRQAAALWALRIGIAATFAGHGLEAMAQNPSFDALIVGTAHNLFGVGVPTSALPPALWVIGAVDVFVATLLVLRRWPGVAAWMAFWGLITALARPASMGPQAWAEVAIRAAHFGAPLALLAAFAGRRR